MTRLATPTDAPTAGPRTARRLPNRDARADLDSAIAAIAEMRAETDRQLGALRAQVDRLTNLLGTPAPGPLPARRPEPTPHLDPPLERLPRAPQPQPQPQPQPRTPKAPPPGGYGPPRTGRALYAWSAANGQLDAVESIGKARRFPGRIVAWSNEQAADAYAELFPPIAHEDVDDDRDMGPDDDGPAY